MQVVGYWGYDAPRAEKKKKEEDVGGKGKERSAGKGKRSAEETKAKKRDKAKRQKGEATPEEVGSAGGMETAAKVSGVPQNSSDSNKTKKPRTLTKAKPDCEHLNKFVKMPFVVDGAVEQNWLGKVCAKDRPSNMSNTVLIKGYWFANDAARWGHVCGIFRRGQRKITFFRIRGEVFFVLFR